MNVVIHRNIDGRGRILDLAEDLGADRIELANTQYYGWARLNRAALLPPCPSWTGPRSFIPLRVDLLSGTGFSVMAVVLAL